MLRRLHVFFVTVVFVALCAAPFSGGHAPAADTAPVRRQLRVALYPYVPEKAEMYWALEQAFEDLNPGIDLRYVDTGDGYYSGQIVDVLKKQIADVVEIDSVFLRDIADQKLTDDEDQKIADAFEHFEHTIVGGTAYLHLRHVIESLAAKHLAAAVH